MEGERDNPTTGKGLTPLANYWHLGLWVFSWHLHTGSWCPAGSPSQKQLGLAGLGQLGMLVQDVTLPISPIYANAGLVYSARALSALLIPDPTLRNQEGAAPEPMQLSFHRPWPPREESQRGGRPHVTFHGHGFQDAKLLEDSNEQQHNHGHGAQLHTLDAHGERGRDRGAPLGRALPAGARAGASRPASGAAAHMPRTGGAMGVGGTRTPRRRRRQ